MGENSFVLYLLEFNVCVYIISSGQILLQHFPVSHKLDKNKCYLEFIPFIRSIS